MSPSNQTAESAPPKEAIPQEAMFEDVATILVAMGIIGGTILVVGTWLLPATEMTNALAWPGVDGVMQSPARVLVVGCCVFLMLPFVRNAALVKCFKRWMPEKSRNAAIGLVAVSTCIIAGAIVFALR